MKKVVNIVVWLVFIPDILASILYCIGNGVSVYSVAWIVTNTAIMTLMVMSYNYSRLYIVTWVIALLKMLTVAKIITSNIVAEMNEPEITGQAFIPGKSFTIFVLLILLAYVIFLFSMITLWCVVQVKKRS